MAACGYCRNACSFALASGPPPAGRCHRRDTSGLDELGQGSFADAHVTAELVKLDPSLRDQAPDEPRLSPKPPGYLVHIKQRRCRFHLGHHAAFPAAERSLSGGVAARRLASLSAA